MPLHDRLSGRAAAFSLIGLANTVAGVGLIVLCGVLGLGPIAANLVGYTGGLLLSFTLNSRITFRNRSRDPRTVLRFLGAFAVAFASNLAVVSLAAKWLASFPILASLAGTPVYTACFFLLCEKWVFQATAGTPRNARGQ